MQRLSLEWSIFNERCEHKVKINQTTSPEILTEHVWDLNEDVNNSNGGYRNNSKHLKQHGLNLTR